MFKLLLPLLLFAIVGVQASVKVHMQQLPDQTIRVFVTNPGNKDVQLLKHPNSVLETDLSTSKFKFTSADNSPLPTFNGAVVSWGPKYATKIQEIYVTIPAGASIHFDHDLFKSYTFPESGTEKKFTITLSFAAFVTPETLIPFLTPSLPIVVTSRVSARPPSNLRPLHTTQTFNGCTDTQSSQLSFLSTVLARRALVALGSLQYPLASDLELYRTWFGDTDENDRNRLIGIYTAMTENWLQFDCSWCEDQAQDEYDIGATYKDMSDPTLTIYPCPKFWNLSQDSDETQLGMLLHTASRFNQMGGGTQVVALGREGCQQLAIDSPQWTVSNADSVKYFALEYD